MKPLNAILLFSLFILSCGNENSNTTSSKGKNLSDKFTLISAAKSGITFQNAMEETKDIHHFWWPSMYNGGGVAVGDVNNDNLPDIFFTGNFVEDALYINKGDMKFEDVSKKAGILGGPNVSWGVVMEDVNNDGWLDIYVCKSGFSQKEADRTNLLYINNKDGSFTESGAAYGLNNTGYSTQAAFFDFDKDGDLDMYLMNQPSNDRRVRGLYIKGEEKYLNHNTSDRFFINNGNNTFTDISEKAGIRNFSYGLGMVICDLNEDNLPDIYIANDYDRGDFIYINNGNGTFTDEAKTRLKHMSNFAMGVDIGDLNNDALSDVFVLDMAGATHYRSKTNMESMSPDRFWKTVDNGYHYQYMHNTLQLNNGNNTFSDISLMTKTAKTDWSWSVLLADFDNSGYKDIYITNGIKKDVRNNDWVEAMKKEIDRTKGKPDILAMIKKMPANPLSNYFFKNNGDLSFTEKAKDWGLDQPGFSNGAAYADLDLDGDLDLVTNNINANAFLYRNDLKKGNYIRLKFTSKRTKRPVSNTKVNLYSGDQVQTLQLNRTKGFFSSSEAALHFGLGKMTSVDSLVILWPDNSISVLDNPSINKTHLIDQDATKKIRRYQKSNNQTTLFAEVQNQLGIDFQHKENTFDDYALQLLLPHKQSEFGPCMSVADVNGDGLEDFYIGGAAGNSGSLYTQQSNGKFKNSNPALWNTDKGCEDLGSIFFDADGDGDKDLYVVSGGYELTEGDPLLQDRLYINNGKGNFNKNTKALPNLTTCSKKVIAGDFDKDGDQDLFVGGQVVHGKYPYAPTSYLLLNEGGKFKNVTKESAPELEKVGMIQDAIFTDFDKDNDLDLIVLGEWMPISFYENNKGTFSNANAKLNLPELSGWWYSVKEVDLDSDGDMDYVFGNVGKNSKFKASEEKPFEVYGKDFDSNGNYDVVLASYSDDKKVPVRGRQCSSEQLPFIAEKFPTFDGFAKASLDEIFDENDLNEAVDLKVNILKSIFLINNGNGFTKKYLPLQAQLSPINGIEVLDINGDGHKDIVTAGNMYGAEVETTRYDAGTGSCMLGDGKGNFTPMTIMKSGFIADGHVKDIKTIHIGKDKTPVILVANNDAKMQAFKLTGEKIVQ